MAGDSRLVLARFMVEEMIGVEEVVTVSKELTGIVEFFTFIINMTCLYIYSVYIYN